MIDFLSSKLGLLVAGMLMLGMIGGLVNVIQEAGEQKAYDRVADDLASTLSNVASTPGEMTVKLVFERDMSQNLGIHFPQYISGSAYVIHLYTDTVILYDTDGNARAMANIAGAMHGWDECSSSSSVGLSSSDVEACDAAVPWVFSSTEDPLFLDLTNKKYIVDSEEILLTFLHAGEPMEE
ncbi:MAG: hypothetical protein H8D82_00420 [Euryarchaeota archaeon]|nr:hypothetical protein [Euryarchaeota archaeon]